MASSFPLDDLWAQPRLCCMISKRKRPTPVLWFRSIHFEWEESSPIVSIVKKHNSVGPLRQTSGESRSFLIDFHIHSLRKHLLYLCIHSSYVGGAARFLIAVVIPNTAHGWERKNWPRHVRTKILEREHQEKLKHTLCHLVTSVDSEGDLLNLSRNDLKIAYLRLQGALSLVKYIVKAPNQGKFA
jgi:hypothetical protein